MRTITLELLRHGPAHNQLLSPLTPYLALCENHAPVTVTIPFEHNQFLHRLTALTYEFGDTQIADDQRKFQLQDTGRELSRILSSIPGLTAELNRHKEESNEVIHLRLVLSASELALLPFELVLAGNGFPGFGQPLLLQNQAPICLTRETRRVKDAQVRWAPQARVLFVCASPEGLAQVPVDAHLLALRRAVDPWVRYFPEHDDEARRTKVNECLHVLSNATIEDIQQACATHQYTHVHILAHGVTRRDGFDLRFGLALHSSTSSGQDVVSGDRLASALQPLMRPQFDGFGKPLVVTLASCNAANQGSVVGAGASIAHALQSAGIPLVIAGQFPLSFAGSVELVETLYEGLLWGADPRALLMDLRRRMHVLYRNRHDWAALTAYATLSGDFEQQVEQLQVGRAKAALSAAMDFADKVLLEAAGYVQELDGGVTALTVTNKSQDTEKKVALALARIEQPWVRLKQLKDSIPVQRVDLRGLLASLAKRRAEVVLLGAAMSELDDFSKARRTQECRLLLEDSRLLYKECYDSDRGETWAAVQYICLTLLLEKDESETNREDSLQRRRELRELWRAAYYQSQVDVHESSARGGWALGNLIELPLLARLLFMRPKPVRSQPTPADVTWPQPDGGLPEDETAPPSWLAHAIRRVDELARRAKEFDHQDYSTYRQLQHYAIWYRAVNNRFADVSDWAEELLRHLPRPTRSNEL